jgi:hypothetical protein
MIPQQIERDLLVRRTGFQPVDAGVSVRRRLTP